jgi:hypothetical protein
MRSFIKFVLTLVFVLGLPVVVWLAVPKLNGFSMAKLESGLRQHQAYTQLNDLIQKQAGNSSGEDTSNQIGALVKDEISADYLQTKIESLLNQTADWSMARTATPPSISLNDLKAKLEAKSPMTVQQINDQLSQLKDQQGQLLSDTDPKAQKSLQQFLDLSDNINQAANGDWTISLAKPMAGLPGMMKWYTLGLPIAAAVLGLCLVGILLLGVGRSRKLKGLAWALLITGVWNGLLSVMFGYVLLGSLLLRVVPGIADIALIKSVLISIQQSVFANYGLIESITSLSLILIGAVLLIVASRINKGPVETKQPDQPQAQPIEVESIVSQEAGGAKTEPAEADKTETAGSHFLAAAEAEAKAAEMKVEGKDVPEEKKAKEKLDNKEG